METQDARENVLIDSLLDAASRDDEATGAPETKGRRHGTSAAAHPQAEDAGIRRQYEGLPRQGIISNFLLAKSGNWAIRYVCNEDTYAAYVAPGVEKALRIGQTVKVDWFIDEDYAIITPMESSSPQVTQLEAVPRRHAAE